MNFDNKLISIWHVGGRDGFLPYDFQSAFDNSCEIILIDAADIGKIEKALLAGGRKSNARIFQIQTAIWDSDGTIELHHTECAYAASIKKLDTHYSKWFVFGNGNCDYLLGEAHTIRKSEFIQTRSIDSLVKDRYCGIPEILSIDAQGCSLEILQGAVEALQTNIDAVVCEAELIPFYGGTPSFADILKFMSERRMIFVGFTDEDTQWASPYRVPIGLRSKAMLGSVDAIFLRDPITFSDNEKFERISSYIWVVCIFGHLDLAVHIIRGTKIQKIHECRIENSVICFARELYILVNRVPELFPPTFRENSSEAMAEYNSSRIVNMDFHGDTEIECFLKNYGFDELATETKRIRLEQMPYAKLVKSSS